MVHFVEFKNVYVTDYGEEIEIILVNSDVVSMIEPGGKFDGGAIIYLQSGFNVHVRESVSDVERMLLGLPEAKISVSTNNMLYTSNGG